MCSMGDVCCQISQCFVTESSSYHDNDNINYGNDIVTGGLVPDTVGPQLSIIQTLGYPNAISNFKIPKDNLIFCKTK